MSVKTTRNCGLQERLDAPFIFIQSHANETKLSVCMCFMSTGAYCCLLCRNSYLFVISFALLWPWDRLQTPAWPLYLKPVKYFQVSNLHMFYAIRATFYRVLRQSCRVWQLVAETASSTQPDLEWVEEGFIERHTKARRKEKVVNWKLRSKDFFCRKQVPSRRHDRDNPTTMSTTGKNKRPGLSQLM